VDICNGFILQLKTSKRLNSDLISAIIRK